MQTSPQRDGTGVMRPFELFLFAGSPDLAAAAEAAAIDGVVVDWEWRGKAHRQSGRDTQINRQTALDLRSVRTHTSGHVICRLNGYGPWTPDELESAVAEGADEVLLPMVRQAGHVERTIELARGRCQVGMLIETLEALRHVDQFRRLPLSRIYVGLNDLAIERGSSNIFDAVSDGTVESVRQDVSAPFGFAGLTLPDGGHPIKCRLLIDEMARLDCQFSFLRRSFLRDVPRHEFGQAVRRIKAAVHSARRRSDTEVTDAHQALSEAVMAWS